MKMKGILAENIKKLDDLNQNAAKMSIQSTQKSVRKSTKVKRNKVSVKSPKMKQMMSPKIRRDFRRKSIDKIDKNEEKEDKKIKSYLEKPQMVKKIAEKFEEMSDKKSQKFLEKAQDRFGDGSQVKVKDAFSILMEKGDTLSIKTPLKKKLKRCAKPSLASGSRKLMDNWLRK